jgi:hypothetical protein
VEASSTTNTTAGLLIPVPPNQVGQPGGHGTATGRQASTYFWARTKVPSDFFLPALTRTTAAATMPAHERRRTAPRRDPSAPRMRESPRWFGRRASDRWRGDGLEGARRGVRLGRPSPRDARVCVDPSHFGRVAGHDRARAESDQDRRGRDSCLHPRSFSAPDGAVSKRPQSARVFAALPRRQPRRRTAALGALAVAIVLAAPAWPDASLP